MNADLSTTRQTTLVRPARLQIGVVVDGLALSALAATALLLWIVVLPLELVAGLS